jgi:hypothetical protein
MSITIVITALAFLALGIGFYLSLRRDAYRSRQRFEPRASAKTLLKSHEQKPAAFKLKSYDETTDLEDLLDKAVRDEDYELAAAIRDELNKRK